MNCIFILFKKSNSLGFGILVRNHKLFCAFVDLAPDVIFVGFAYIPALLLTRLILLFFTCFAF
ncbi:MAG: hypothetical protein ACTSYY_07440, partial [Promethearchaeota archaeon]